MTTMTALSNLGSTRRTLYCLYILFLEFDTKHQNIRHWRHRVVRNLLPNYQIRIDKRPNALFRERCAKYL